MARYYFPLLSVNLLRVKLDLKLYMNITQNFLSAKLYFLFIATHNYAFQQSYAAPFCENYAKLYFDAEHLKKGLNRRW